MWTLNNDTPFAAERTLVCDRNGAAQWVVCIKCTYEFDGREFRPAEQQDPVHPVPLHRGDPLRSSLAFECDLDYTRGTTDILFEGHAYAERRGATSTEVSLQVGSVTKRLVVHGARVWQRGLVSPEASAPEPFDRLPITYEHAYGGVDSDPDGTEHGYEGRNPAGTGFSTTSGRAVGKPLPNIEYPHLLIKSWSDRPPPAGFGPIARHWSPRRELAGTFDAQWERDRMPLLPADFDDRFYQCAPADQQSPTYLVGAEPVRLSNLVPEGLWQFRLPSETFVLQTRMNRAWIEHRPALHSVTIRGDTRTVLMLWKSAVPCHHHRLTLEGTTIIHKPRVRVQAAAAV